MPKPSVLCVVGVQDAGKTTTIVRMVAHYKAQGLCVAVMKHDGHLTGEAEDDWEKPGSDTWRYQEAGADATLIAGGGRTLLRVMADDDAEDVYRLCERFPANGLDPDLILVEGYKRSELPKVVVLRDASEVAWVEQAHLANVVAIVCPGDISLLADSRWPVYHEAEIGSLCETLFRLSEDARGDAEKRCENAN